MKKSSLIFFRCLFFVLSIIFSFGIVEIFLRIHQPFGFRLNGEKIVLPKNTSITYELKPTDKLDSFATVKKNSIGFRGEEPPSFFSSHLTLVTIGGSTTESIVINEGKTWTDLLNQKLKKNFSSVWINNAGLDGASTFGHLTLLNDYVVPLKPKYALFLVGVNDLALFEGRENDVLQPKEKNLGFSETLLENSEIIILYKNFQRYKATESLGLKSDEVVNFDEIVKSVENYPDYRVLGEASPSATLKELVGDTSEDSKYLSAYQNRLEMLIKNSRENNIEPVLITQPAVYGDAIDDMTNADLGKMVIFDSNGELGEGTTGLEKWKFLEEYNQITRSVAKKNDVLVVDLARKLPKSSQYFYDFIHFSNRGSEKVSEIIYDELCPYLWERESLFRSTVCTLR